MRLSDRVPEGYGLIDLPSQSSALLRVGLLVRDEPEALGGRLVTLESHLDVVGLLGGVVDAGGRVMSWLRVVVQDVEGLAEGQARHGVLTNGSLEERWRRNVEALRAASPEDAVTLGWEATPAPVLMLDPRKRRLTGLMHEASGEMLEVCRDDRVLMERGLPAFSASLHRYLWAARLGSESPMVPVTAGAPSGGAGVVALSEVLTGINAGFEGVNLRGGMVMARRLHPARLEALAEVLGGGSWSGVQHGVNVLLLDRGASARAEEATRTIAGESIDPDRLYLGRHGRWGRLVETLHLKLRLLAEAVQQVRAVVTRTRRPLFNITASSFEADMHDPSAGLPRLWTTTLKLIDAGTAAELEISADRVRHVIAPEDIGRGVYKPVLHAQATGGTGSLRVRAVHADAGSVVVEGTLRSQERIGGALSDLLVLRMLVGGERAVLYARIEDESGLASGEVRLRTLSRSLPGGQVAALRAAEGVPIEGVGFEVLPMVSTPCDLHALGVLAVRLLLVDGEQTLPVALDEVLSLAGRVSEAGAGALAERVEAVFTSEARWAEHLGPHRLVRERVDAMESLDLVPPDLWFAVLALVVRMFPGRSRDAFARDLGDAPASAPQRVFDGAVSALDELLVRTRSLVVIDWRQNREVHAVLRRFREGLDRAEAPVIPRLG